MEKINPTTFETNEELNSKVIIRAECRICLKNDGSLPIYGDEAKPDISMEISLFGGVQLHEMDDLPQFICENCFKLLESAILFRKCAKRADGILRRRKKKQDLTIKSPSITLKVEETVSFQLTELVPVQPQIEENSYELVNQADNNIDFVSVEMDETNNQVVSNDMEYEEIDPNFTNDVVIASDKSMINTKVRKKNDSKYNCKYCNLTIESLDIFEEHRATVEHKRNYIKSFLPKKTLKKLSTPYSKSKNPKNYLCEICSQMFTTKGNYLKHMLVEHKIKSDNDTPKKGCPICGKKLHPSALNNHIKQIHNHENDSTVSKVKIDCKICHKSFSHYFYPLHMQRHEQGDTKNYVCDQCGKKFFFKSSFYTHRLIHTNALPHKCEYCPYRGRTKELLKIHVRTHTGDYPYKCNQCDTSCSTKSNLNSHMRRHRGPIDFICDICSRGFYSKIQLERHISVIHYGIKNHICSICGAAFGYRHGLMSHQRKVHKRAKGLGKPKAVYLQLEEQGLLQSELQQEV